MPELAQPAHEDEDPVPGGATGAQEPEAGVAAPQGLFWSWELDLETLQAVLSEPAPWNRPRPRALEDQNDSPEGDAPNGEAHESSAPPAGVPAAGVPAAGVPAAGVPAAGVPAESGHGDHASADGAAAVGDTADGGPADAGPATDPAAADPAPADSAPGGPALADSAAADPAPDDPAQDDQDALLEELIEATLAERTREVPIGAVAGRVAESLSPSPDLAGWLATTSPKDLENGALPGVAASFRRLASWAQAGELAAVAEMASRAAATDDKIGVNDKGCPARISDEATAQVSLALAMTRYSASWWTDLAVTLTWRLAATGEALAGGHIDLPRARLIADATATLDDEKARVVEERVLPGAGDQTTSQLRAQLRRAVIAADPEGAEQRRQEAERRARVSLYPDEEGTATLAGQSLPGTRATAAMARISAMARALKAAGAVGGMDLLRAQVFIGLLLGTLPGIPPAPDGPPGEAPPDDEGDSEGDDGGHGGAGRGDAGRGDGGRGDGPAGQHPGGPRSAGRSRPADAARGGRPPGLDGGDVPGPSDADAPADDALGDPLGGDPAWATAASEDRGGDSDDDWIIQPLLSSLSWSALPILTQLPRAGPGDGPRAEPGARPRAGPGPGTGRPPPGLLDLTLPWETLAGCSPDPGYLGRLGPVTPSQAREIADAAAGDPGVEWRVILISRTGQAIAVTRITMARASGVPNPSARASWPRVVSASAGADSGTTCLRPGTGLVGRVTLTVPEDILAGPPQPQTVSGDILARALRAAGRAAAAAANRAAADAAAGGGCAHTTATPGYRPASRLREYIVARDLTCRFPFCGQPAWRGDLDHTRPWDKGGRTCSCNLGGLCRHHHILKQHPGWQLVQVSPGTFLWTTSAGRTYAATPDRHAA
jgi:hypothetical protein